MNRKALLLSFVAATCLLFGQEADQPQSEDQPQSGRNVTPTVEIRYDDFLDDMTPTSSIGLLFDIDNERYAGFDVNTTADYKETRILLGWNWTVLGVGTREINEEDTVSIFSFGVKYSVLQGMYSTIEYVMIDDDDSDPYLRLAIGVRF